MKSFSLDPQAEKELEEACTYYREQGGNQLANAFLAEFERVAVLLCVNTGFGTPAGGKRRSYPLRRFPYSLIYRDTPVGLRILVVGHQHRKPGYWVNRA